MYTQCALNFNSKQRQLKGHRMKKLMAIVVVSSIVAFCVACFPEKNQTDSSVDVPVSSVAPLLGSWIIDVDGDVMFDP
jgi:hypothetical protein